MLVILGRCLFDLSTLLIFFFVFPTLCFIKDTIVTAFLIHLLHCRRITNLSKLRKSEIRKTDLKRSWMPARAKQNAKVAMILTPKVKILMNQLRRAEVVVVHSSQSLLLKG